MWTLTERAVLVADACEAATSAFSVVDLCVRPRALDTGRENAGRLVRVGQPAGGALAKVGSLSVETVLPRAAAVLAGAFVDVFAKQIQFIGREDFGLRTVRRESEPTGTLTWNYLLKKIATN